jgi:diguanylate cyclase (GGDEF)-like protein
MQSTERVTITKPKSRSLFNLVVISVLALLLIATTLFVFFGFMKTRDRLIDSNTEQMSGLVQAFSEIFDGDSIEIDLQERKKNANYDMWNAISDSTLKKNGIKYLYVTNIDYGDSVEIYLESFLEEDGSWGESAFLEKESIADFNVDMIKKLKEGKATSVSFVSHTPSYGWLISTYVSIKNSNGKVVAFIGADKEMNRMNQDIEEIAYNFLFIGILFIVSVFFAILFIIRKIFIYPIKRLIKAADNFNLLDVSFENLDFTRLKEYDALIESFKRMEMKVKKAIKKSFTDDLTKLNNRYYFNIAMENILKPVEQAKKIAFFIIDIDYFKQINDSYGHEKGDFVLRCMGAILQHVFEELPGVVARLGGDEFAVCLDDVEDAKMIEEKCKELKERLSHFKYSEDKVGIGVSVGVAIAEFSSASPSYTDIFSTADTVLYKVKAKGRNGYEITEFKAGL